MGAQFEEFLRRHDFLTEAEHALVRDSHQTLDIARASVESGFVAPVVAEDATRLADAGMVDGLDPKLPGLVLLAEIGKGARGTVYRAWQVGLRRLVAVKVFEREMLQRPEDRTRFVREARIAARLSHPSLMRAWDIGSTTELVFIVLEYVEGETLKARLDRVARESGGAVSWLPVPEALRIATSVADGLAFIAANGITHRDIKPANIQLNEKTIAKILDLGLARPEGVSEITTPLTAPGTPAYISPEQARGEPMLSPKADVYALGLLLYRMLAGSLPFEARSAEDMLRQHLTATPPPLELRMKGRASKLPEGLAALIDSMLRKDPIQRPESAFVAGALRHYLEKLGEPVPEHPVPPVVALPINDLAPSNASASTRTRSQPNGASRRSSVQLQAARAASGSRANSPAAPHDLTGFEETAPDFANQASAPSRRRIATDDYPPEPMPSAPASKPSANPLAFRGWSLILVLASAVAFVTLMLVFANQGIGDREKALLEREEKVSEAERKVEAERAVVRKHQETLFNLARAAEAEIEAGVPLGDANARLRNEIEDSRKRLDPPSADR